MTRNLATRVRPRGRALRLLIATSFAVLVGVGVAGCGGSDDTGASDTTTTTATAAAQGGGGTQTGSSGQAGAGQSGSGQSGGGESGGGASGPTPTIVSFTTPENIDCHNGNFQNFTASWETTNATRVSISGGGDNLPPSGSTSLPFDCSSAHTFTLTAYGSGGQTATQSVTLQPRNVQPTDTTDTT